MKMVAMVMIWFNNNFIGIGTDVNTKDITVSDITLDGNSGNSIRFLNEQITISLYSMNHLHL